MPFSKSITVGVLGVAILFATLGCFKVFQNETVYKATLNKVSHNYCITDQGIRRCDEPFVPIEEQRFNRWDAAHYLKMKTDWYEQSKLSDNHLFAFFPLFPFTWKTTGFSAFGIGVFNYACFVLGLALLVTLFEWKMKRMALVVTSLLLLPTNIVFMVPYTEALFFATMATAIWAYVRGNNWMLFIALVLNALTRTSGTILILSMVCVDGLLLMKSNFSLNWLKKEFLIRYLPILLGTFLAMLFQQKQGSPGWWYFIDVQEIHWKLKLGWPEEIKDWSKEGFALNLASACFLCLPLTLYLFRKAVLVLLGSRVSESPVKEEKDRRSFVFLWSATFIVAMFFVTVFYRSGSINTLFRYTVSTAFFSFIIMEMLQASALQKASLRKVFLFGVSVFVVALIVVPFAKNLTFQWAGSLCFFLLYVLLFEVEKLPNYLTRVSFVVLLVLGLVGQAYLYNQFLSGGWIFL